MKHAAHQLGALSRLYLIEVGLLLGWPRIHSWNFQRAREGREREMKRVRWLEMEMQMEVQNADRLRYS
jgi:hypothetical protein